MWTADEPEILGSLAKVDVLKDSISCQRDMPMICLLSGRNSRLARLVERRGVHRRRSCTKKPPVDRAEFSHTPCLAKTSLRFPPPGSPTPLTIDVRRG